MALLKVKNLTKRFGGLVAVNKVEFEVEEGTVCGLIGPNGAGKTTCFNLISGFIRPDEGSVIFNNENIVTYKPYEISSIGAIRTFQHTSLFPSLTVKENILAGFHNERETSFFSSLFNTKKFREENSEMERRADNILKLLDLEKESNLIADTLPYGRQRILEIGISLAANPKILLMDEPAAGLNPNESEELVAMIREIKKQGITVVIVEHDMKVVMNVCDKAVVLDHGKKIAEGTVSEIRNNPQVIKIYLGDDSYANSK